MKTPVRTHMYYSFSGEKRQRNKANTKQNKTPTLE